MNRIDSKYDVVAELAVYDEYTEYHVKDSNQEILRLLWFNITDNQARTFFHRYRAALKSSHSEMLYDAKASPSAYYIVWHLYDPELFADFLQAPSKYPSYLDDIEQIASNLASRGFSIQDARLAVVNNKVQLADLRFIECNPDEVLSRNALFLSNLQNKMKPAKPPINWLGIVPGILLLLGAGYGATRAVQAYLNPPVHTVPSVINKTPSEAAKIMSTEGYRTVFVDGEDSSKPLGVVIAQEPAADTALHINRLVNITINNPPPANIPKITDMSLEDARRALEEDGFKLGQVVKSYLSGVDLPVNAVMAQIPEAGTQTARGSQVSVVVYLGERQRQTFLPDLKGMTFEQARAEIQKASLVLNKIKTANSDLPEGTVLSQEPEAYKKSTVGSPVTLTVAQYTTVPVGERPNLSTEPLGKVPEPIVVDPTPTVDTTTVPSPDTVSPTPDTTATTSERVLRFNYTFPSSLDVGLAELRVADADGERVLFQQEDAAGANVPVEVLTVGEAEFRVYLDNQLVVSFKR